MKCPYRKTTTYIHNIPVRKNNTMEVVNTDMPCTKDRAERVVEEFMDCLRYDCVCFVPGLAGEYPNCQCRRVSGESK